MSSDITITLKKQWDYAPHIKNGKDHPFFHVVREKENKLLQDFLSRRTEGALLLSGKRGIGKTSTVFNAIHQVYINLKNTGVNLIPVLVNAPNFEIRKESKEGDNNGNIDLLEFKRVILQNLVRALYKETVVYDGKNKQKLRTEYQSGFNTLDSYIVRFAT